MTPVVFAGPSTYGLDPTALHGIEVRPPAAQGDVYATAVSGTTSIGIVDGVFEHTPAVWHKEVLWAMSRGVYVVGAASMGALRAVELHDFGMVGVGSVFEQFRSGELTDDDEVAVVHASAADDHRPLSDAMVDIRATVEAARRAGVLSSRGTELLIDAAKRTHYPQRHLAEIVQHVLADDPNLVDVERFARWLPDHRVHRKRDDARELLDHLRERGTDRPPPVRFRFQHTDAWDQVVQRIDARRGSAPTVAGEATDLVLEELYLRPVDYEVVRAAARRRGLALAAADGPGASGQGGYGRAVQAFRRTHGLDDDAAVARWLHEHGISEDELTKLLLDDAVADRSVTLVEARLPTLLHDVLRRSGRRRSFAARAESKLIALEEAGLEDPTLEAVGLSEEELWGWFRSTYLPDEWLGDPPDLAHRMGFADEHALRRAALREYAFSVHLRDQGDAVTARA